MKRIRVMAMLLGATICASLLLGACGESGSSGRGSRPKEEREDDDDEDRDDREDDDDDEEDEDREDDNNGGHENDREDGGNGGHENGREDGGNGGAQDGHVTGREDNSGNNSSNGGSAADAATHYDGIEFKTTDLNGNPITAKDLFSAHEYTMINIWASWCGPCIGEIPELQELSADFEEKDCAIVGILWDGDDSWGLADGKEILSDAGATYLNLMPPSNVDTLFPSDAVPTSYFVDRNGHIVGDPIVGAYPEGYVSTLNSLLGN